MAQLKDIKKSLSELSDNELRARLSEIRSSRLTKKGDIIKRKTDPNALDKLLKMGLSKEALIKLLGAKK